MSARFAVITASLLARKGEAQPWAEPDKKPLSWQHGELPPMEPGFFKIAQAPQVVPPPASMPAPPLVRSRPAASRDSKKIAVRMSLHDYERLGILAVKQSKSRQCLLQEAVDRMLGGMAQNFGSACACLGANMPLQVR